MANSTSPSPWSPHLERPKAALRHLRSCAPSQQKEMRLGKSSELNTSEKIRITSGGSYQHCNGQKKIPLPMMRRSILSSLTEACTLQLHALQMPDRQRRSTQSTDKASWNHIDRHWQMRALRAMAMNQESKKVWPELDYHTNLYKLCAGCRLGVTWAAHTLHIRSTTRTFASTLTRHVNGTDYR